MLGETGVAGAPAEAIRTLRSGRRPGQFSTSVTIDEAIGAAHLTRIEAVIISPGVVRAAEDPDLNQDREDGVAAHRRVHETEDVHGLGTAENVIDERGNDANARDECEKGGTKESDESDDQNAIATINLSKLGSLYLVNKGQHFSELEWLSLGWVFSKAMSSLFLYC